MDDVKNLELTKSHFGDDFLWGVSTAAFQIEGAHDFDGKGLSIWDVFTSKKGAIKNGHEAQTACDFYHRYKEDIELVKTMNIPNFRFSLSWSRLLPDGESKLNQSGVDYYNNVIDFLIECGITPWITLYHWDLPHNLELKGGWTNRDSISWFSKYATIAAEQFGDRVKNWMVMNEPSVFTGAGYFLGVHAPGRKGLTNYTKAIHHVTLATVAGAKVLRKAIPSAHIGTTFSCTHIEPFSKSKRDIAAAKRVDTLLNRTFIEPILGLGYPQADLPVLKKLNEFMDVDDAKNLSFDFDFIGLQCYTREIVKSSFLTPYIGASIVNAANRKVSTTAMGWEVYPKAIKAILKKFDAYEGIKKIIITENGAAFPDQVVEGQIFDFQRLNYLREHLMEVLQSKSEGVKVSGYFVWSLTDNFEWAEGYHPRFGLIYIDFETQKRTIKQSGKWYSDFLSSK